MERALRRWSRKNHEARIPAGEHHRAVLRQRRPSAGSFAVEHEVTNCAPVSQANQAAGEDVVGAKAETNGTRATAEVNASDLGLEVSDEHVLFSPTDSTGDVPSG